MLHCASLASGSELREQRDVIVTNGSCFLSNRIIIPLHKVTIAGTLLFEPRTFVSLHGSYS